VTKVLIVEDNDGFRATFSGLLRSAFPFLDIIEARDGDEALIAVHVERPRVIFMDVRLPGANGLDLTRQIKKIHADSVIAVMSNFDMPEYRDAALRNGAVRFMVKDSSPLEMLDIVGSILDEHRLR